jgi:hypothetical protein
MNRLLSLNLTNYPLERPVEPSRWIVFVSRYVIWTLIRWNTLVIGLVKVATETSCKEN